MLDSPLLKDPVDYLRNELESRQARRSGYSLRAFARDLNLSPSTLSEILSHKVGLSPERGHSIARRLKLSSPHDEHFCDLIMARHARSAATRSEARIRADARMRSANSVIALDKFAVISDWYHYAILELVDLSPLYHDVKRLARALGLDRKTVQGALERLVRVGELEVAPDRWRTMSAVTTAGDEVPSQALKKFHSQILRRAESALYKQEVGIREYLASFFCIDDRDMPQIKKDLDRMRSEIIRKYGHKPGRNKVYSLSLQLMRLTEDGS